MAARARNTNGAPTTMRQVAVLLEEVRSQQQAMLEAMDAWGERLERSFDTRFADVNVRLSNLEAAVLQNSRDIKQNSEDIKQNSEDIARLTAELAEVRAEVRGLRSDFAGAAEKARVDALDARVTILERRLKSAR